ncbi:MAG TPA: glycosyltransferase family 39 protein [Bryobacteraceae bacterium]|nr:glycosyltransferase family 39 protein [Bryobacteraceae bacterium]
MAPAPQPSRTERMFTIALRVCTVLSALCVLTYSAVMVRNRHELTLTESVVAAHSTMLAHDGTLYYDLKSYPYTVCGYPPVFYSLQAMLVRIGLPALLAGRTISFLALLALIALCWRLVMIYAGNRYAAWLAAVLASSSVPLLGWGTTGVVDTLGVAFSVAAFYQFSRFYVRGENTLVWAGLLAAAGFLTKQSMLAAPAAMFLLLLVRNRKTAFLFGSALAALVAAVALGINRFTSGRFFGNTVIAMMQPYAAGKAMQHVTFILLVSGALIVAFLATVPRLARSRSNPLLVYFVLTWLLLAVMAPKVGSDANYHIEPTVLLIVCTAAGLAELNFFGLVFANSKSWVTLLQAAVGVFLVMNYRVIVPDVMTRIWRENQFRTEAARVEPYLRNASGPIFSVELDPVIHVRGRIDVEPYIYTLMVNAHRIDPEPMREDLARCAMPVVILYEDIAHPIDDQSLEIGRLIPSHAAELEQHYHLVEHIPGPYLAGVYVYLPNSR